VARPREAVGLQDADLPEGRLGPIERFGARPSNWLTHLMTSPPCPACAKNYSARISPRSAACILGSESIWSIMCDRS
jgi:hypothetical protein